VTARSERPLIAIGICTRQRNALLRVLLESIWAQPLPPEHDVEVIIVDNNDAPTVTPAIIDFPPKFKITLIHEAKAGLVNARNRVFDEAAAIGADWLIGVDDDEYVAADWLAEFIRGIETLDADIIIAARHVVYSDATSPFVERIRNDQFPAGEESKLFSTANFAVSKQIFDSGDGLGLRFHPSLNESGGEDYEFFLRAKYAHGVKPVKWPYAVANENLDGKRAQFRYQFRRRLIDQLTCYRVAALHRATGVRGTRRGNAMKLYQRPIRFAVFGTAECLLGVFQLLTARENARKLIGKGLLRWARALAIFPYFMGKSAVHYGASVNADRTDHKN